MSTDTYATMNGTLRTRNSGAITGLLCATLFSAAALSFSGCGTYPDDEPQASETEAAAPGLAWGSDVACALDSDCATGTFCFQRTCVWECETDADCTDDGTCSDRSRCVAPGGTAQATSGLATAQQAQTAPARDSAVISTGIEVTQWPPLRVPVLAGQVFIDLDIETSAPVPGGEIFYSVRADDSFGTLQAERATGETQFTLRVPTGAAGLEDDAAVAPVLIATPFGERTVYLTPSAPRDGTYSGTFAATAFGGTPLPFQFSIQTEPERVATLADATSATLAISTNVADLISLPLDQADVRNGDLQWLRRPLTFEEDTGAWVATFAGDVDSDALFGDGVYPHANRSFRVEISGEEGETLRGAIADRWRGLYDRTTADGVRTPGVATISGRFVVDRHDASAPIVAGIDADLVLTPPRLQDYPELNVCDAATMTALLADPDLAPEACGPLTTASGFEIAGPVRRAECAEAVANVARTQQSLSAQLLQWISPTDGVAPAESFREFIAGCASGDGGLCEPTANQLCARQLVAYAIATADSSVTNAGALSEAYDALTREAYIGRQLVAFYLDTTTRLDWLRSSEAPEFLAAALQEYNESILREYQTGVLDAHLASVFGQLDAAGLAVLTHAQTDPDALATRATLLSDLINSWRASMDSLTLLATRWDVLYQNETQRTASAAYIRRTYARLYVVAAILQEAARESGSSYMGGSFGAGFSSLVIAGNRLRTPFDDLLFARDAEVVTAQSVDPTSTNASLLGELSDDARAAIADAASSVDRAIDEEQDAAVLEANLVGRYVDQVEALRNELIELCGLPIGCTAADVGTLDGCDIDTRAGICGTLREQGSTVVELPNLADRASISQAGQALFELREAVLGVQSAEATLTGSVQVSQLLGETAEAFALRAQQWNVQRRSVSREVDRLLDEMTALGLNEDDSVIRDIARAQNLRASAYSRQEAQLERRNTIEIDGINRDIGLMRTITGLNGAASVIDLAADRVDLLAAILADGAPKQVGLTTDTTGAARMAIRFPAFIASTITGVSAEVLQQISDGMANSLEGQQMLRDAELGRIESAADLIGAQADLDIAAIEDAFAVNTIIADQALSTLDALIEALQRNTQLDLDYERDLVELRDRRDRWFISMLGLQRLEYEVMQAQLTARQRELGYYGVVQRAQLIEGRYRNAVARSRDLSNLLGSPDVLFSSSNRIALAESRLERARRAMDDWLTALEYYAVRPFVSQRLALLLARNPGQLEAIANELSRLQLVCGGPVTHESVDLSLRDDLLSTGFATVDSAGVTTSGPARLRALLARAETPASRAVRYSDRSSVGERLDAGNIWAASFDIDVEGFANLGLTCNAKLSSVAVQIVGEDGDIGPGESQPVVTVIYGGAGSVRSCQPGIDDYVAQFGPGATAFGPISAFRTPGRAISPVAGIGDYGPELSWSSTLEGLPFASNYTVLIDLNHPSNAEFDWEQLEDIRLRLSYTYQDVFPQGQCE